jgi:hypothetical protein
VPASFSRTSNTRPSISFGPTPIRKMMKELYGKYIYSTFGFADAFNLSFNYTDVKLTYGRVVPEVGWVDDNYLGIDEGLTITMIENFRSGFIWRVMRRSPYLRRGLERAGFQGGWLDTSNSHGR